MDEGLCFLKLDHRDAIEQAARRLSKQENSKKSINLQNEM